MQQWLAVLFVIAIAPLCAIAQERPNVVIIYGDDVGFGDVGVYGSEMIPTPRIDQLANEGIRFTDGHCAAATCTPSRFSMLTGILGFRQNVSILPPGAALVIPTGVITLPKLFKKADYHTAVVGKWHLGLGAIKEPIDWNGAVKPGPLEIGFDYSFLLPSTNDRVPCVYLENHHVVGLDPADPLFVGKKSGHPNSTVYPDGKKDRSAMTYYQSTHGHDNSVINGIGRIGYMWGGKAALWDDETMADVFVEKAAAYIRSQAQSEQPFFLYFASQDIHVPRAPHKRFQGTTELGYRGDAMVQFDWTTGAIMDVLEEQGLTDNTIVIFSSDNGPVYDDGYDDGTMVKKSSEEIDGGHDGSGPYRGGKYQIHEGGTRVPFIIRWPAKIPAGTVSTALVSQIDLMASFAALLDVQLEAGEASDSRNCLDAFLGTDAQGHQFLVEEAKRIVALRKGPWKFFEDKKKKLMLYNLESDLGEQTNVAADHPEVVAEMKQAVDALVGGQPLNELE